ncbi:MAG: nucleotidyltransferase family protein [Bacteroidaceae bacterium]|nr:nucleotidyltransferase family protein [Bacteroidaceae bacterium]
MEKRIKERTVSIDATIISVLKKMDSERVKLLFVFSNDIFNGIVTIGDIQRAIIKNIDLTAPISSILNKSKIYAKPEDDIEKIKEIMLKIRTECMPVVDEQGNLEKVYFWSDLFDTKSITRPKINLPVVIMAGGKGTRLKPLTYVIPKPLVPIGKKTILEEIMDQFEGIGCTKFYMSVNYKYDMIEFYLNQLDKQYDISFFREEKPLGTIGSVSLLKDKITTPFFVSNCDILIDQDYRDVYEYHKNNKNDLTIVTAVKSHSIPYGVITTGENGIMEGLSEKPETTYMINTGVYLLNPELISEIPENEFFHITHLMEKIKQRGGRIGCFPVSEKSWTDIGEWPEYLKLINVK